MSMFPPYDRRASSRRAAQPAVAAGVAGPAADATPPGPPAVGAPGAAPAGAPAARACANCGTARVGEYCAHCGQHFLEDRLSFRVLAAELWERVTFERGLLRTFREMLTDPGGVARRYVQGQRRRYASPVAYLLVGAALSLLLFQLFDEQITEWMRGRVIDSLGDPEHPILTPAQVERNVELTIAVSRQTTYTSLSLCALFACALRLVFRRSGVNLVESFVLALYTFGHVFYLALPVSAIAMLWLRDVSLSMFGTFPLYVLVCGVAGAQFFGRPVRSALKAVLALVIAYGTFSLVTTAALVLIAMRTA